MFGLVALKFAKYGDLQNFGSFLALLLLSQRLHSSTHEKLGVKQSLWLLVVQSSMSASAILQNYSVFG
jgi:hypothetical protein